MKRSDSRLKRKLASFKQIFNSDPNFRSIGFGLASCALLLTVSNGAIVYASDSNAKSDTLIENQNGTAQILSANDGIAPTDIKSYADNPHEYVPNHAAPDYHNIAPEARVNEGLWRRFFGFADATARQVAPNEHENMHMVPHTLYNVDSLGKEHDGSELLWDTLLYKVENRNLEPRAEYHEDMVDQIHRGITFVSYLLHLYTPQASDYNVPLYIVKAEDMRQAVSAVDIGHAISSNRSDKSFVKPSDISSHHNGEATLGTPVDSVKRGGYPLYYMSQVRDRVYEVGPCAGMTYIEADLKGKCKSHQRYNGLLLLSMPLPEVARQGVFLGEPQSVGVNAMSANYLPQGMEIGARLVGFNSSFETETSSFGKTLHSFDKHLYSVGLKKFVEPNTALASLGKDCSHSNQKNNCQLFFVGNNVNHLLSVGNVDSKFDLHSSASLDVGTPDATIAMQIGADLRTDLADVRPKGYESHAHPALKGSAMHNAKSDTSTVLNKVSEVAGRTIDIVGGKENKSTSWREVGKAGEDLAQRAAIVENRSTVVSDDAANAAAVASASTAANAADAQIASADNQALASVSQDSKSEVSAIQDSKAENTESLGSNNSRGQFNREIYGEAQNGQDVKPEEIAAALASGEVDEAVLLNADLQAVAKQRRKELQGENARVYDVPAIESIPTAIEYRDRSVKHELYGIPVSFSITGKPNLELRNTILSSEQYKNYSMLTELEMTMLSDLGYRMEPREFYGTSIYSFGSAGFKVPRNVRSNFSYYDHETGGYNPKLPSRAPLATGVHIYGSYNDVMHGSKVSSVGAGSIGVRVDGSNNYYYQTPKSSIVVAGRNGIGLAYTYGCNNDAYLSGYIGALGDGGIGVKVDMGSNIYSDLIEYRGSYTRVRTLDYLNHSSSKAKAAELELPDDLKGPQIVDLIIDGVVEGERAAIYIDDASFVKNIHITTNGVVNGGIYSLWNPAPDVSGKIVIRQDHRNTDLIDGVVQLPRTSAMSGLTTNSIIARYLTTDLNLGVLLDENNHPVIHDPNKLSYIGNDKSRVVLAGDIIGRTINIKHFAGKSSILGDVVANNVTVHNGIFSLAGPEGSVYQMRSLQLGTKSVLDLVNGADSQTYVTSLFKVGRDVVLRVDTDEKGRPIDKVSFSGNVAVAEYQLTVEPGVSYADMRRFGADPKALMRFITDFMNHNNKVFASKNISLRFPHYIWDNAGGYGREIKCTASGCHMGGFVSNHGRTDVTDVQHWRYYVSFGGIILLILCFYLRHFYIRHIKNRKSKTAYK